MLSSIPPGQFMDSSLVRVVTSGIDLERYLAPVKIAHSTQWTFGV